MKKYCFWLVFFPLFTLWGNPSENKDDYAVVGILNIEDVLKDQSLTGNIEFHFFTDSKNEIHSLDLKASPAEKITYIWKSGFQKAQIVLKNFPIDLCTMSIISISPVPEEKEDVKFIIDEFKSCFANVDAICSVDFLDSSRLVIDYCDKKNNIMITTRGNKESLKVGVSFFGATIYSKKESLKLKINKILNEHRI